MKECSCCVHTGLYGLHKIIHSIIIKTIFQLFNDRVVQNRGAPDRVVQNRGAPDRVVQNRGAPR